MRNVRRAIGGMQILAFLAFIFVISWIDVSASGISSDRISLQAVPAEEIVGSISLLAWAFLTLCAGIVLSIIGEPTRLGSFAALFTYAIGLLLMLEGVPYFPIVDSFWMALGVYAFWISPALSLIEILLPPWRYSSGLLPEGA